MFINLYKTAIKLLGSCKLLQLHVALIFFTLLISPSIMAKANNSGKVMAGFLMHFTNYSTWPELSNNHINICLVGDVGFDEFLMKMVKSRPENRQGQNVRVYHLSNLEKLNQCQIAYTDQNKSLALIKIWEEQKLATLLVGQHEAFIDQGGMIKFFVENKRIRFEINLARVKSSQVVVSSELLRLAKITKAHKQEVIAP